MSFLQPEQRQTLIWASLGLAGCVLLYSLSGVLTPFLAAAILAYVLNPGTDWLSRHRWPRALAVAFILLMSLLLLVILLLIIVPVVQREIILLQSRLPQLLVILNTKLAPRLHDWFHFDVQFTGNGLRKLISDQWSSEDLTATVLASLKVGSRAVLALVGNAVLVPMVLFYLLLDWHILLGKLKHAIPLRWTDATVSFVREIDALLAQFLRGQILVMVLLAAYYSIALALAGFDVALPVGIFTGLMVIIPYLGFTSGLCLALLGAILQFADWYGMIAVLAVYGVGQVLESFYLTPRLVGERIGLHPLAVIFALLAFGELFGFFGVLLALPASAALLVGLRHIRRFYLASEFYRRT